MIEKYTNPYIKVVWEDTPENFTKEKMGRIKTYFGQKYNSRHIKIVTKSIINENDVKLNSLEASDKVMDPEFQKSLIKDFIKENEIECNWDLIDRLDNNVNGKLLLINEDKVKYNKWYIKNVTFSNFLSFGEDNKIDYTKLNGITVIESVPKNFGGKTTSTVDLLLFLFFNTTTKTKTMIEVFNKFTDKDRLWVKGEIEIDSETYIIERTLTRKKKNKGNDYTVTNKLEFFKILDDGTIENLNDEKRQKTETLITSAIGTEEDFLTTIMTTGNNLEDLIESKPTARGQILTKFLGLENIKTKEEVCKEMYNTWSKTLVSNNFNQTQLETDNKTFTESIEYSNNEIKKLEENVSETESKIVTEENNKDVLLTSKSNNVNLDLIKTNPDQIKKEISDIQKVITEHEKIVNEISVIEPSEYYKEDEHDELRGEINKVVSDGLLNKKEIETCELLIKHLEESSICPSCKQSLKDVDNTVEIQNKKDKIEEVKLNNEKLREDLKNLNKKEEKYKTLKREYDEYEKNKIIKGKNEIIIEQKKLEVQQKENLLSEYDTNKQNFEKNKKIDEELVIIKTRIESLKGILRSNNTDIEKHRNNIVVMSDKIQTNKDLIEKIKKEQISNHIFKVYLNIFGKNGISKVIMKNMIPLLNQELLLLLVDSCHFILELNVNDKNEVEFIMIDTETRVVKPLSSGSGYEKTISSLALRSVLTKISTLPKPNIVVMDEIFGKIADDNLEMVGEFFKKIKNYFEHIILISHNPLIRNWSDNVMIIKKENNVSFIDEVIG